ncbi:hypothetical protein SLEP1_g27035 [Rubroshorea leprosula]|uniref:NB-ARC domain-containing protein n=1 Tax=Rubroshorea leprosula TaxID=152421 RepID=A0AAV5JPA5_9ROSI|nr:hypothetical protein SLEP1_g27035 [Rubroshorea leprosula]
MEKILEKAENFVDHYRKLEKDTNELKSEFQFLKRRKIDIDSRIETEVRLGQVVKEEVKGWLEDVKKMEEDIQDVEERVHSVSRYNRISLDILVREKIEEVKRIQERGNFNEGLVIERAPARGIIIPTENIEGEISTKDEIQKHLMDDKVRFQKVIWVTVSYPLNVFALQKKIADAMHKTLQEDEEEMMRAAALMDIMGSKSFVLILDDVWEKFSLKDVGIPEPVQNKSKVVITTRSIEVCKYLGCKIVKVQPLSQEESLNLFLEKVGRDVLQKVSGLEETLKLIVEECKRLPLAIVVIAGSLKGEYDIAEWRNALNELRQCVKSVKCVEDEIFGGLRFSYDRLKSLQIQECFLYCSFFQEDYEFSGKELIEDWIDEGLIDEWGSRRAAYDRGRAILNRLQQNCLLEKCFGMDRVKMHDVVRDMAIKSIGPGFGYMVKAGMKLKKVPNESEWERDLKKVSLMANGISKIPIGLSLKCPLLSTLILSHNPLSEIPSSFFEDMVGLKVLDLSWTDIEALPDAISNLLNLSALRLRYCRRLMYLPSLAELRALKKLDLHRAGIKEVPQGSEMLVSLEYLDIFCRCLKEIPTGILPKLSSLQNLVVDLSNGITTRINLKEIVRLGKLESLKCEMEGILDFNYLVNKSKDFESLTAYNLQLIIEKEYGFEYGVNAKYQRKVVIVKCEIGEECIVLPDKLEALWMEHCKNMKNMRCSLNKAVLLENATELRSCFIEGFEGIECLVELDSSSSSLCYPVLNKLEELDLWHLPSLCVLVRVEGVATPPHIFSNLKRLRISECFGIRKLFPLELLHAFQNLEQIHVRECKQMEEIIASSDSDASSDKFPFPKLRILRLWYMDQLKSICSGK